MIFIIQLIKIGNSAGIIFQPHTCSALQTQWLRLWWPCLNFQAPDLLSRATNLRPVSISDTTCINTESCEERGVNPLVMYLVPAARHQKNRQDSNTSCHVKSRLRRLNAAPVRRDNAFFFCCVNNAKSRIGSCDTDIGIIPERRKRTKIGRYGVVIPNDISPIVKPIVRLKLA